MVQKLAYRKMHIRMILILYEKFYFTPGDLGFKFLHEKGKLEHLFVGINGILKRLDWLP
jgi:hypothetical protein